MGANELTVPPDVKWSLSPMDICNTIGVAGALPASRKKVSVYSTLENPKINKMFRWASVCAAPAAMCWVALSPLLLGAGPPNRLAAAALAALERPVFVTFVAIALLGAINGVDSPWRRCMAAGGTVLARLSFGALLLHMLFNKSLLATRLAPGQLDRQSAISDWFGVATISYAAALPLALLVELPAMELYKQIKLFNEKSTNSKSTNKSRSLEKSDLCTTQCNSNNR